MALRQPMARDLREIVAALKIASDLERICDYAANVAKRSIALAQTPPIQPVNALPQANTETSVMRCPLRQARIGAGEDAGAGQ